MYRIYLKLILSLFLFCSISGGLLGCTNALPEFAIMNSSSILKFEPIQSPNTNLTPTISLSELKPETNVELYLTNDCSGTAIGTGISDGNGLAYITTNSLPGEGTYYIYALHREICSDDFLTYEVDTTPPNVLGLSNDLTPTYSKTFSWSCDETCEYRWVIDQSSATIPSGSFTSQNSTSSSNLMGTFYLHVQAIDDAGNIGTTTHISFALDNTAPLPPSGLSLVTPASSPGNVGAPIIQVSGINSGDTVEIFSDSACTNQMGSAVSASSTVNITSSNLTEGSHNFWAKTTDSNLLVSSCSSVFLSYTFDQTPPAITGLADDPVATGSKTWNWGCDETCTYRWVIDVNASTIPSGVFSTATSDSISGVNGTYYLHIQAMDAAGNESSVVHVSAILDSTTPPQPSIALDAGTPFYGSSSTPVFTVSNLNIGDTITLYKSSNCSGTADDTAPASATTQNFTSSAISTEGYHYFSAKAVNDLGNASNCSNYTKYHYDTTPPPAPSGLDDGTGTTLSTTSPPIKFNTVTDISTVSYQAQVVRVSDSVVMKPWTNLYPGNSLTGLAPLTAGAIYRVDLKAYNSTGLYSTVVQGDGFTYDYTAPTTAPSTPTLGPIPSYLNRTPSLTFTAASDPESGILYHEVEVYRASDNAIIIPWSKLEGGIGAEFIFDQLLVNQESYYVKVRGVNQVHLAGPASGASSSWVAGCNSNTISTNSNTAYSTDYGHFCFVVPAGVFSISVKAWGAGGGGAAFDGAAGGYVEGTINVTPGELLWATVGQGGEKGATTTGGSSAYGNGGRGYEVGTGPYRWGAGGGGYTGLFRTTVPLFIAGAGGGGHGDVDSGVAGVGGGTSGGNASHNGGQGGSQLAGGAGGVYCGEAGAYLKGGNAQATKTGWGGGGGGGAGYFGGGGGCRGGAPNTFSSSGGGGSSYFISSATLTSTISGSLSTAPNNTDPDRTSGAPVNIGEGGVGSTNGGPGRIFISW